MTQGNLPSDASNTGPALSAWRRRKSEANGAATRTILEEAHSDRGRVIFSASFRRLSQKTQVFALSLDGARTRLTHSLEVAHIGTYIVDEIFKKLDTIDDSEQEIQVWKKLGWSDRLAIRSFVEVSCLVHDIGNPPFGHFGEKAICNWFKSDKGNKWLNLLKEQQRYDFTAFDGNKQGFRILTRLQRNGGDLYSLNLTATQLASTIKYPTFNQDKPSKCSFFESEKSIKEEVWSKIGLSDNQRHPLSLLMEAADDIAYCVSDLEDAAEKDLITPHDLSTAFGGGIDFANLSVGITKARTALTNRLVQEVANRFVNKIRDRKTRDLSPILDKESQLEQLRSVTSGKVYSSRLVLANEITGFKVIQGILKSIDPLTRMNGDDFSKLAFAFESRESIYTEDLLPILKSSTPEPSLVSLFPRKHLSAYRDLISADQSNEYFHRLHLFIDCVSGMTDDFALDTYRLLSGQVTYGNR